MYSVGTGVIEVVSRDVSTLGGSFPCVGGFDMVMCGGGFDRVGVVVSNLCGWRLGWLLHGCHLWLPF